MPHWTDAKRCAICGQVHCYWCGATVSRSWPPALARPPWRAATREHLQPRALGGGGGSNVVVACKGCNEARGVAAGWVPFHLPGERPPKQALRIAIASSRVETKHGWVHPE